MPEVKAATAWRAAAASAEASASSNRAVRQNVLHLALPAMGEQVLLVLVGIVDTYLVGQLSVSALAAVGLANQFLTIIMASFAALAVGATALVARQVGAGDRTQGDSVLQQSLLLGLIVGVIAALGCVWGARGAMALYRPAPDVIQQGAIYLRIAGGALALQAIITIGNAALRGAGDTRTPLYLMIGVNAVNVVVSWLLIHGPGPFPALGVTGSAIGAAVARGAGALALLALLLSGRARLRLGRTGWRPSAAIMGRVLRVGLPAGGEQLLMQAGLAVFTISITRLGTASLAAHQVALRAESLSGLPSMGFAVAATTLVGQSLGANDQALARRNALTSVGLAMALVGVAGLLLAIFARPVAHLFTNDASVALLAARCTRIWGLAQAACAGMTVLSGALRGAGDTRYCLLTTAAAIWLVRVPLTLLVVRVFGLGLVAVWVALLADHLLRGALYAWRFRSGAWARVRV